MICEDFEQPLDVSLWNATSAPGTSVVERTAALAHWGAFSLHVQLDPTQTGADLGLFQQPTTLPSNLYVRAFVYVPDSPQPTSSNPEGLLWLVSADGNYGLILGRSSAEAVHLTDWSPSTAGGSTNWTFATTFPSPVTWTCLEWNIQTTGSNVGNVSAWVDGVPLDIGTTDLPIPTIEQLQFSVGFQTAGSSFRAYFDDIFVDSQPIGCAK